MEQRCDQEALRCVADGEPVVTLVVPTAAVTTATFVISGKITDDGEFTADWSLGSGPATPLTLGADGAFSVTVDAPLLDSQAVFINVTARDGQHEIIQSKQLLIDRVAPTLVVTMPSVTNIQSQSVMVAANTMGETAEVTVAFGGVSWRLNGGPDSWVLPEVALPTLDDATLVLQFSARDAAGNTNSVDRPIVVDNVTPSVTITSPVADSTHRTDIAVSATTVGAVDSVTATFEGLTVPLTGGPSAWVGTVTAFHHDFASGTLRVTVRDASGNSSFDEVAINVDRIAPVITFTSPNSGQKFNTSSFASTSLVSTSWTITDGDPQAATTTVNGAASTALSVQVPTNATDNPASYTTTVVVADRAGNTTTGSLTYSVDRVVPTIVSWTPAANARMVEPPETAITFSEPVFGATTTTPGLALLSDPQPAAGGWDVNHDRAVLPLSSFAGRVVRVGVAALADAHGNPVALPAERRFHFATTMPTSGLLASEVQSFAATSDPDGALVVSYMTTTGSWRYLVNVEGELRHNTLAALPSSTKVAVSAWSTPDPATLSAPLKLGTSAYNAAAPAGSRHAHYKVQGLLAPEPVSSAGIGAVVSAPPLNREAATDPFGVVLGATYTRGSFTRTFSTVADMITAQSADSWAVASYSGTQVRWSRYRCNRDAQLFPGPTTYSCEGTEYGGSTSPLTPDFAEAVMTRNGSCMLFNLRSPQGPGIYWHGGFLQPLENCDGALGVSPPASCNPNTNLTLTSGNIGQKLAPFSLNGEHTVLFAFPAGTANPSEYRLEKMQPGTCSFFTTFTPPFVVPGVRDYQPVQIGTKPAFIYVNVSNELRVFIP